MKPELSVCVPHWNRPDMLGRMVGNYAELYADRVIQFSVCDDGSTVPVPTEYPTLGVRHSIVFTRLPRKPHPLNPCVPINRAVAASTAPVVVLTNPEVTHPAPVLDELLDLLDGFDAYVTAPCRDVSGLWLAGPETDYTTHSRSPVPPGAHFHFLAMCHRTLWDRAGGFDEDYRNGRGCDDNDWLRRLERAGAVFRTSETAVQHEHVDSNCWKGMPSNAKLLRQKWPTVA